MTIIQPRRDTAANWTSNNPVLTMGELGYETDTKRQKRGDGATSWTALSYMSEWSTLPGRPAVVVSGSSTATVRSSIGLPYFIDVADSAYSVTPGSSNPEVGIQQALDFAAANGIPEVIVSQPGTYTVDIHVIPGQTDVAAAFWLPSNLKLTLKPGVIIKVKNGVTLPAGATQGHIISVINPYPANSGQIKTNVAIEGGGIIDGNAANQTALIIAHGVFFGGVNSGYVKDVTVRNVYGTNSFSPGETMHFEANRCRDIRYINCVADGSGSANTATGFSADNCFGISWSGCVSFGMGAGMGFTNWQCSGVRYSTCHAYLNGCNGFNAERSEGVTYASCVSGARTPDTTSQANLIFFPSGQQVMPNGQAGFNITGCTDVVVAGCVSTYNTQYNVRIGSNSGATPTLACTRVLITGGNFTNGVVANQNLQTGQTDIFYDGALGLPNNIPHVSTITTTLGDVAMEIPATASAVNHLLFRPRENGFNPSIEVVGANTNISLNLLPKGTGTVQAGSVDVVTTTGGQTLLNKTFNSGSNVFTHRDNAWSVLNSTDTTKRAQLSASGITTASTRTFAFADTDGTLGVKVAVPSTGTSAGVVGSWAADSSYFYVCTAANTWRRVATNWTPPIATQTANYTATAADGTLLIDATAGAVTVTLPAATTVSGILFNVKKIDSTANTVTIDPNGSELIDGVTTKSITTQWVSIQVQSNGTSWFIL